MGRVATIRTESGPEAYFLNYTVKEENPRKPEVAGRTTGKVLPVLKFLT